MSKRISLPNKLFTIVDDDDYELYSKYYWHITNKGYVQGLFPNENGVLKPVLLHNLIHKKQNGFQTDHINRNKLDNRKSNLRYATNQENSFNRNSYKNSKSKYKGVCPSTSGCLKKWRSVVFKDGIQYDCGLFDDEIEAALAYSTMARFLFGDFASCGWSVY